MNECLINIKFEEDDYLFCFDSLTWKEALDIEAKSYNVQNNEYILNSELEKRTILKSKIKWLVDNKENNKISENLFDIFDQINHKAMEIIWQEYYKKNYLTANEASFYYEAAKKYFSDDEKIFPTPSIVVEVGMMLKNIISFSREEFSKLSMKEFEIIQLIISLKS
jgi:hypothetical protein